MGSHGGLVHPGADLLPDAAARARPLGGSAVRDPAYRRLQHGSMLRYSVIPDDRRVVSI